MKKIWDKMQKHGLNVFTILLWGQSIQTALPPKRHFEEPTSAVDPGQLDECCSQSKFVSFCLLIWKTDTYVFVFGILGLSCKLFPLFPYFSGFASSLGPCRDGSWCRPSFWSRRLLFSGEFFKFGAGGQRGLFAKHHCRREICCLVCAGSGGCFCCWCFCWIKSEIKIST